MWFHRLSYPRLQIYAIPYITEIFYAGSAVVLAILITVNVALVGNDVVTELKDTPDFTDTKWWAPRWLPNSITIPTTPGPCQPLTLPQQSTSIRTNSTLPIFAYTLMNGLGVSRNANGDEEPKWYDAPRYRAEPLRNCTIQNMTALINFQDRGHKLTSQIVCSIDSTDPETPPSLKLSTTFSRMANTDLGSDDVVNYISSYSVPQTADIGKARTVLLARNVTALKMLGVLDAIGSDLLKAMWAQKWSWKLTGRDNQWPDQAVVKWADKTNCTSERKCRSIGVGIEGIDTWYSNTRGSQRFDLDLGRYDQDTNIFLSNDAFKARIISDPFLGTIAGNIINVTRPHPYTQPYSAREFWNTCTWGWGCLNGTWTDALLSNNSAASNVTNGLPLTSLQNSSFTYTLSIDTEDYESIHYNRSACHPVSRPTSPYATVPIKRYDPVPDHIFIRAPRKEDELPQGACTLGAPSVYTPKLGFNTLAATARSSQFSLNPTASRDTLNLNAARAIWDYREPDPPVHSPPRATAQDARIFPPAQLPRKPHQAEDA
ncbi:hypothetical protein AG1IA_03123 [Rhizoctonia solani AG-1 IA]|uniref:Transmembrane protein n=1 Tax=Thanatephorus cucumeris (strain AG1-IA) TaxID=983506 RepID=L8WXY7_THACA|nr:hypothetical protein AG1IA_03123 [Rhizoctonia solani AG-1 IA]